jgi:hypothetical protein
MDGYLYGRLVLNPPACCDNEYFVLNSVTVWVILVISRTVDFQDLPLWGLLFGLPMGGTFVWGTCPESSFLVRYKIWTLFFRRLTSSTAKTLCSRTDDFQALPLWGLLYNLPKQGTFVWVTCPESSFLVRYKIWTLFFCRLTSSTAETLRSRTIDFQDLPL